jgi:hypothetical protein
MKAVSVNSSGPVAAKDSAARDLAFLAAWEDGALPRSIDAGTILRVRQMRRAAKMVAPAGVVKAKAE